MKAEPKRCTARGKLVRDTGTGAPTGEKLPDGQHSDHYVLCPEDRAKGYVEPYRDSYFHVGPPGPKYPLVDVSEADRVEQSLDPEWIKYEPYPAGSGEHGLGRYWTQVELDKAAKGACGTLTRMPAACAATYAAQPGYYGSTFCCGCHAYFPVGARGEFVWDGSDQRVGTRRSA